MAWERRGKSGAMYFYQTRRTDDGKVVKEYVGRGQKGRSAAEALARAKAQREAERQAIQSERASLAEADRLTAQLIAAADLLLNAALLASGYHRVNYGKWRRRRGQEEHGSPTA